jgi:hypothetical protein
MRDRAHPFQQGGTRVELGIDFGAEEQEQIRELLVIRQRRHYFASELATAIAAITCMTNKEHPHEILLVQAHIIFTFICIQKVLRNGTIDEQTLYG